MGTRQALVPSRDSWDFYMGSSGMKWDGVEKGCGGGTSVDRTLLPFIETSERCPLLSAVWRITYDVLCTAENKKKTLSLVISI